MVGRTISHYKIVDKIGEGGMGVVYRAIDTRLDRPVAIKVLSAGTVTDPERVARFVQEAKAASALNHPNIVTIYEIGAIDGTDFIAMEYVQGQTLDRLIGHKGLSLNDTLRYAVQMTDALAGAHAAGIVHRDIKPANIVVTDKGLVKVLDFGLAKLVEPRSTGDQSPAEVTRLAQSPRTEVGTIVGTVAYMSPEQAEGKKVDARSDIFSCGSVLYEMVTGKRAFEGDTKLSTLTAILREEPKPVSGVTELVPRELERIIQRCLRKEPARRFQHVDDLKVALAELHEESSSGKLLVGALPEASRRRRGSWALAAAAGVLLVGATALVTRWATHGEPPSQELTLTRLTSDAGLTEHAALSEDGKLLAFASDRSGEGNLDIWVQQIGGGGAIRLTRGQADESEPAFAPDGTRIAFRSERAGGGIDVVSTLGGEPVRIADRGRTPRFSPDGKWLAYWVGDRSLLGRRSMYVMPAAGGQPRALQTQFHSAGLPAWSPDGSHLLFLGTPLAGISGRAPFDWWVTPLEGGEAVRTGAFKLFQQRQVFPRQEDPAEWVGGNIIFSAGVGDLAGLWQVPISPSTWQVSGQPRRLTSGTGLYVQPSVAASGVLVFSSLSGNPDLWSYPLSADGRKVVGDIQRLTSSAATDVTPSISEDGKKIAFLSDRSGNVEAWLKDLATGGEVALTNTTFEEATPHISPDGSSVAYSAFETDQTRIYATSAAGGVAERICDCRGAFYFWSRDRTQFLYKPLSTDRTRILIWDRAAGKERTLIEHPKYSVTAAGVSPDERWVSFQTIVSPHQRQIFIAPMQNWIAAPPAQWIPITDGSGLDRNAVWSRDGNLLYFLSERDEFRCIWAQPLDPLTKRPSGPPFAVQHFHQASRSLGWFQEIGDIGMSVTRDRLVFSMPEYTGNIWMAKLENGSR